LRLPSPSRAPKQVPAVDQNHARILDAMGFEPVAIDALADRLESSVTELASPLLELELAGRLVRLPGQRVQRLETA
jgi:DNA processing protein